MFGIKTSIITAITCIQLLTSTPDLPVASIKCYCYQYNVDCNLAIAISKLETAYFTSELFIENHNFGGMWYNGEFMSFATYSEGCETFVKMLKYNYIDEGLVTPIQIQKKYCPGNSNWTILVEELMKGEENGCS